jgi:hypothetical protein
LGREGNGEREERERFAGGKNAKKMEKVFFLFLLHSLPLSLTTPARNTIFLSHTLSPSEHFQNKKNKHERRKTRTSKKKKL